MSKIEILAPVGNEEMLRAAVFSGADAVYLGFSGFNARTSANNFNADTLKDAVTFCHARGVAVHVALNTTVYGGELPALEQAIRAVAASGADAVDILFDGATHHVLRRPWIETRNTHGTGCTLSAAIAASLALGARLDDAVARSKAFVWEALASGQHRLIGKGNGPVDHHFALRKPSHEH